VDSAWIPGKMSQKGKFHSRMHGILVESMLIPGSFLVESRKMFSVIICMDSTWIPGKITQKKKFGLEIQVDCMESTWIPGKIIQKKKSKKIQKKSKKYCDHESIRIMILCYAKMKSAANISALHNQ
jgi:hypothetical protein